MAATTYCELRRKDVVNICNGTRLGCISDLELDDCTGCISAIVVPGPDRLFGIFKSSEEVVIPFGCIRKIGADVILVEVNL